MNKRYLIENRFPVIERVEDVETLTWIKSHLEELETNVLKYGGILLRGFEWHSVSEFNKIAQAICPNLCEYVYRSTPRTRLGGRIYTTTEYPAERTIPQHNENAYAKQWPAKLILGSILVPDEGGETPLADSRKVYEKMPVDIKQRFEEKKIMYVRNYRNNMDLSWEEVFQTDSKEEVEKYCREHDIEYRWDVGTADLQTRQICQATLEYPVTKEKVWFNQAHLFHESALSEADRQSIIQVFGEKELPRNAYYGDGSPIDVKDLEIIRSIYNEELLVMPWQPQDLMIVDNVLMTHGRNPYKGERKVVIAMG